jgi:hypothetical protein
MKCLSKLAQQLDSPCRLWRKRTEGTGELGALCKLFNSSADDALLAIALVKGAQLTQAQLRTLAELYLDPCLDYFFSVVCEGGTKGYTHAFECAYQQSLQNPEKLKSELCTLHYY